MVETTTDSLNNKRAKMTLNRSPEFKVAIV